MTGPALQRRHPLSPLRRSFTTPQRLFYAPNHAPIPSVDPAAYPLGITGDVRTALRFSLGDLRHEFPAHTVAATLQCAGNRRAELMALGRRLLPGGCMCGVQLGAAALSMTLFLRTCRGATRIAA